MHIFAISYVYSDDPDGLAERLPAHRMYVAEHADRGDVLMSGPLGIDEQPGALFILRVDTKAVAGAFSAGDPLVEGGQVARVTTTEWLPKLGRLTAHL